MPNKPAKNKTFLIEQAPLTIKIPDDELENPPSTVSHDPGREKDPDIENDEALRECIDELDEAVQTESYIKFYRIQPNGEKIYIKKVSVIEYMEPNFGEEGIFERFGGGKFEMRVYAKGRNGLIARRVISIEGLPRIRGGDATVAASSIGQSDSRDLMIAMMKESQQQTMTILTALIARPEPAKSSLNETIEAMLMIDKMKGSGGGSEIKTFLEAARFVKDMNGEGGADSSWIERMAEKFLPEMMIAAKNAADKAQAPEKVSRAGAAPVMTEEQKMQMMLKAVLSQVVEQAKINAPVEPLAREFFDNAPDNVFDLVVNDPQWWPKLIAAQPSAAPFKSWFERLHAQIISLCPSADNLPETAKNDINPPSEQKDAGNAVKSGISG